MSSRLFNTCFFKLCMYFHLKIQLIAAIFNKHAHELSSGSVHFLGALKSQDLTSRDLFQCSVLTTSLCLIQGVLYELLVGFMFVSSSFRF